MSTTVSDTFLLSFTPERWSAVRRFLECVGPPLNKRDVIKGAQAVSAHLNKFDVIAALADRLAPGLVEDRAELYRDGYSPANRSREFAAVVETLICELYSSLDGVRRTLFGAYREVAAIQNGSTERLFKRAARRQYGPEFPEELRLRLAAAYDTWFPELRALRTELTHGEVGSCYLGTAADQITYSHGGLGTATRALVIQDIIGKINELASEVRSLIEAVFEHVYAQLEPVEKRVGCGVFRGRFYERILVPQPTLTFGAGKCVSRTWFENEPGLECPMRARCGAYSSTQVASLFGDPADRST